MMIYRKSKRITKRLYIIKSR